MSNYNLKANTIKAMHSLKGILLGITADTKLNDDELLFLDLWLKSQKSLNKDPDVIDLMDLLNDILSDGIISEDELLELNSLVHDIIKYRPLKSKAVDYKVNEFIGSAYISFTELISNLSLSSIEFN